ncbi:MAG: rhamnulokinase [Odoribacteraceae bacterium]|jgi:rhamnulokinase|nr:rhamnulokinase [Odoribacteraceae bacterium]
MEDKRYFLAVDLGATSGRTIVGALSGGRLALEELTRFPNIMVEKDGHFYWDIHALHASVLKGLKEAAARGIRLESIGVDTWGVDVAFVGEDGELLGLPYSYRDPRTEGVPERFFREMSRERLYALTGIQIMNFNTLFQLYAMKQAGDPALAAARKVLFMPDALSYLLTGEMVTEYTIASTSQLLNPVTRQFDDGLLAAAGLTAGHFGRMVMPGTPVGTLSPAARRATGLGAVPVVAVAGHDTASAVMAIPAASERVAYLSSGTWSLMGIEAPRPILTDESYRLNFTNEGGANGKTRFLKNICGMWLLERCREEWGNAPEHAHAALVDAALAAPPFRCLINPDAARFANPPSMLAAIRDYCLETGQPEPLTPGEVTRCILESLAARYKQVFDQLRAFSGTPLDVLHVVGGGSKNALLNAFTANALGVPVVAGPSEATALGNIILQATAAGFVPDFAAARALIRDSVEPTTFLPGAGEDWEAAHALFLKNYKE